MNTADIKRFEGGVDAMRIHLNELVDRVNALSKAVDIIEKWPETSVVVHDNSNTNLIRVSVKTLTITHDLGVIECDCVSGGAVGDI